MEKFSLDISELVPRVGIKKKKKKTKNVERLIEGELF